EVYAPAGIDYDIGKTGRYLSIKHDGQRCTVLTEKIYPKIMGTVGVEVYRDDLGSPSAAHSELRQYEAILPTYAGRNHGDRFRRRKINHRDSAEVTAAKAQPHHRYRNVGIYRQCAVEIADGTDALEDLCYKLRRLGSRTNRET